MITQVAQHIDDSIAEILGDDTKLTPDADFALTGQCLN